MLAQRILRFGIAFVFLVFGIDKLRRNSFWLAQMPQFLAKFGPQFVYVLGVVEIVIAIMLMTRYYRLGALGAIAILLGAIQTLGLIVTGSLGTGLNDIAVRDIGLLISALALLLPWEKHLTSRDILSFLKPAKH